jgi:branched-chain amino acid transport system substrate-binding protein
MQRTKSDKFGSTRRRQLAVGAVGLLAVLGAALVLSACGGGSGSSGGGGGSSSSSGDIVVGELAGSSGAYAVVGEEVFGGSEMAVEKINEEGGVMGRKIDLNTYNDAGSATQANEEFRRALSDKSVAIMGSPDEGEVIATLAQHYEIPDLGEVDEGALTVYPDGPEEPPLSWVYSNTLDGFGLGNLIAQYALKECNSLAILHDPTSYGKGGDDGIRQTYEEEGQIEKIVLDEPVSEDWSNGTPVSLTSDMSKIKESGADCVEVWLTPQDQAAFVTEMHHLGDEFTVLGNDNMTQLDVFQELAGKYADGALAPQLTSVVEESPEIKEFDKEFEAKHHITPSVNAYGAYMGTFILAKAIEMGKSTEPQKIQESLDKLKNFKGLMGTVSYSPELHTAIQAGQLTMVQWEAAGEKWVPVFTGKSSG